jgi:tetratricopeptide (TPR) repeat protein
MPFVLHRFALLVFQQGNVAEAERLYRRTLQLCERILGPEHSETAETLVDFASFLQARGSIREAFDLYRRALRICERALGPEHPLTLETHARLDALMHPPSLPAPVNPTVKRLT